MNLLQIELDYSILKIPNEWKISLWIFHRELIVKLSFFVYEENIQGLISKIAIYHFGSQDHYVKQAIIL